MTIEKVIETLHNSSLWDYTDDIPYDIIAEFTDAVNAAITILEGIKSAERKIKNALFVSVWDGGSVIETPCRVNMETREVFDIMRARYDGDILEREYVEIDGEEFPVFHAVSDVTDEEEDDTDFWYV